MTTRAAIIFFIIGIVIGCAGHYLLTKTVKPETVNVQPYQDTIRWLNDAIALRDAEIKDLEMHIENDLKVDSQEIKVHEKDITIIRNLPVTKGFELFRGNLSKAYSN